MLTTSELITRLDARFSDPASTATPWTETAAALGAAQLSWITTVRSDGRPHVCPLVAVWVDEAVYFCTGAAEQKALNLRANAHVILTTGCNSWDRGLDVVVEGVARPVTDDALLRRLTSAWSTKWDGRWRFESRNGAFHDLDGDGGDILVFEVRPDKVLAFGKGTFSHTTYRHNG